MTMSVIFETLKKLRSSAEGEKQRQSRSKRYRNIYSFRRMLLSPLGVLAGAVLLIIVGLVVSYAAEVLSNYFPHKNTTPVLPQADITLLAGIDGSPEDETLRKNQATHQASETGHENRRNEDLPEPLTDVTVEEIKPGVRRLPSSDLKKSDPPDALSAQYFPPKSPMRPEQSSGEIERTAGRLPLPRGPVSPGHEPSEAAPGPTEGETSRAERIHLANARKAHNINRLVSKIEASMTKGHMDDARAHIDALARLKGEQDSYVLKLRAFWHMCQGDFEASASFLTAVLVKEQDDLEAGINMAIVEIKTDRLDKARKRLEKLREIYPANSFIEELIQKMGR
jgi:hypothetical protein